MKPLSYSPMKPDIKGMHGVMNAKGLKSEAPNWAKDLYKEQVYKLGRSPDEAIRELKRSPFFDNAWVIQ